LDKWEPTLRGEGLQRESQHLMSLSSTIKALVDSIAGARVSVSHIAALSHEGKVFSAGQFDATLADDASLNLLIRVQDNPIYTRFGAEMVGDGELIIFEGTTVSANGNPVTPVNLNRMSALASTALFSDGPTVTADGTEIKHRVLTGDKEDEGVSSVGAVLIMAPNTFYLMRTTNRSGAQARIATSFGYYEPDLG